MQQITIPDFGLVVLMGPSGSGKTTFARRHFAKSEILSSDVYRTVVGDDDLSSRTTRAAFDVMGYIAKKRLEARRIVVIDATNLYREHRGVFANLARQQNAPLTAIVFELSESACQRQNAKRTDGEPRPHHVVRRHWQTLKRTMKTLPKEGFRRKCRIKTPEDGIDTEIRLEPLVCDRRGETRPVDIIGDVHGCRQELEDLLAKLGYRIESEATDDGGTRYRVTPPGTRQAVFLGDLVDRGPDSPGTLELVMDMVDDGAAIAVQGNHDNKLMRALAGRDVQRGHGLAETMEALEKRPEAFRERVRTFVESMASHFMLDGGNLVAAHAGMAEHLQNRSGREVREFGLYGDSDGSTDEDGCPIRGDWGREYRGATAVVYGHTPTARPEWVNNTLCIDTGCVWGGPLTALRHPEREIVQVPARQVYQSPPPKAMEARAETGPDGQQAADQELDLSELQGVLRINTRLDGTVTVKPDHSAAALETMSRFAVDPRWLIYVPPTMAPCRAAPEGERLERPAEAFEHYRKRGVKTVVCQDKHMGSRGIVVVTRDGATSQRRFGVGDGSHGCIYTRTGRRFFDDPEREAAVLDRFRKAFEESGLWSTLKTDWACLDCEIMPWNAKGAGLIKRHFTPVATAGRMGLTKAIEALRKASERDASHEPLLHAMEQRRTMTEQYDIAYRRYSWPVETIEDLKIAPFHLMATEDAVHVDKTHHWHMATIAALCRHDPILSATEYLTVEVNDDEQVANATNWWTCQTAVGHEGMVVKPLDFVTHTERGLVTPAVKCRGREYLRIIYGPEYSREDQMVRLRKRTVGRKMALALREFALGVESLEQFVQHAPLRRVHQAAFGVLALESEPLDPRL